MKNILVTGAGGFIGSHLVERCLTEGLNVTAFLHYNSKSSYGWLENLPRPKNLKVVLGDIRDFDSVLDAASGVDTVFHLAALIGIPYSYVSPLAYIRTNLEGTYNVLQAAKVLGIANTIVTSTSETYGSAQYVPIDEKHPSVGQSPYSASKIAADQLALSYHLSFGMPVKLARPFNTYGPRQSARAIIPTIATQLLSGAKTLRLGNLSPTRDLTFVSDTVSGFLAIARSDSVVGQATNIGMSEEVSVGDLAKKIASIIGVNVEISEDPNRIRRPGSEVERLFCDNRKIKAMTGWAPRFNLENGLENTIAWLKDNLSLYKPDIYNV